MIARAFHLVALSAFWMVPAAGLAKPIIVQQRQVIVRHDRLSPLPVAPLRAGGHIYRIDTQRDIDGMSVALAAYLEDDRTRLWSATLYRVTFDAERETGGQEIHPTAMVMDGATISVTDARGQIYRVDAMSGQLRQPMEPQRYSQ